MNIQKLSIDKLIPAAYNPRKDLRPNDREYQKIKRSLETFGYVDPIIVNQDMTIIGGHQRAKVLRALGYAEVDCVIVDLDKDQEKALNIALNKIGGEWDEESLKELLDDLSQTDIEMELTGFDLDEIEKLLNGGEQQEVEEDDFDADKALEDITEPITKRGDIWQLGRHRLMCGDSTSVDDVERLMDGKKADMVFTDPPYGVNYQSNMRTKTKKFDVLKNDDSILDIAPIIQLFSEGWVFIWTSWKVQIDWIKQFQSFNYPTNIVIWHKPGGGIGDLKHTFSSDYEVALVWHRGAELCGKRIGSVWTINKDSANKYIHPTQKPIALAAEAIDKTTFKRNIVMDLFGGSGSTLIACEQTDRVCYMMELDEKYCDVIIKRWETLTGQKAELITGGESNAETTSSAGEQPQESHAG